MSAPLRVGLIGCGNVSVNLHLPAYAAHPELLQVVGLADPTEDRLELGRQAAGLTADQVHRDTADLIARSDIDIVDVCTPQHLRKNILLAAIDAGKQVLCEKPLATLPVDVAEVIAAADKRGVEFGVMHNYLFFPEVEAAVRIIASGEIGEIRAVTVNSLGVVDVPGAAGFQAGWRHDPRRAGGGVLMDMLHAVYLTETLLGQTIVRASAYVENSHPGAAVEDIALARFETEHNAGMVNMAWGLGPGGIEVTGTAGRIAIRYQDGGTQPWAPLETVLVTTADGTRSEPVAGVGQPLVEKVMQSITDLIGDFGAAIRDGRTPRAPGRQGQHIMDATLAAYESAATGRTTSVPIDPTSPLYTEGVVGIADLELPEWSAVRRGRLFGVTDPPARGLP